VRRLVPALNREAKLVEADHILVALSSVPDTGLFEEGKAEQHPLWARELCGFEAARLGGVGLETVRDRVLRFNRHGPDGLIDGKAPGAARAWMRAMSAYIHGAS
jgi:hypothetical protein